MTETNYKKTINLPKTSFSMKANLQQKEPQIQKTWKKIDLYGLIRQARAGAEKFILHDGPPYPSGDLHVGTAMGKVIKDFVIRFKTMEGFDAPYRPGWDCHGLPIEVQVLKEMRQSEERPSTMEIRRRCKKFSEKYLKNHKRQFIAFGIGGEWDRPYLTFLPEYEKGVLSVFAQMVDKGFAYRAKKPVHWCCHCETVLADAELEYATKKSPSIFVNFKLTSDASSVAPGVDDLHIMIWTTTPWTIPANMAIAVNERFDYAAVRYEQDGKTVTSLMAAEVVGNVMKAVGATSHEVIAKVKGKALLGLQYAHPFVERTSPIIAADYVALEEGTGCVHTAPGHGAEDYHSGIANDLEIVSPLDTKGCYTDEFPPMQGVQVYEANDKLCDLMAERGALAAKSTVSHSYPHCWRCHQPVIFRATEQWFIRVDHEGLRQKAMAAAEQVDWVPAWGEKRLISMIADRPDWVLSRQKAWGVPIPAFYCADCDELLLTRVSVEVVRDLFAERGSNAWYEMEADEILNRSFACEKCGSQSFRKDNDIFDVWFESGSSWRAVVQNTEHLRYPADVYLEGTDQYRGWFQLSLLPSVAVEGASPYKQVMTHGFVVDGQGRKMSKSVGNFVSAQDVLDTVGADLFRLWVCSIDFKDHIYVDMAAIKEMANPYRRIRNTLRYLLGSLHDFDPKTDARPVGELEEIDRWAVARTNRLIRNVKRANEAYDLHKAYQAIQNFCAVDMSAFYLDVLKDRMYTFAANAPARRSAQTAQWIILDAFVKMLAPVLVHTAEEAWQIMAERGLLQDGDPAQSVHLAPCAQPQEVDAEEELTRKMAKLLAVREDVLREIETLRADKTIGKSLEASVTLATADADLMALLKAEDLPAVFIVSEVTLAEEVGEVGEAGNSFVAGQAVPALRIKVVRCAHPQCARCWNYRASVGGNAEHPQLCHRCVEALAAN